MPVRARPVTPKDVTLVINMEKLSKVISKIKEAKKKIDEMWIGDKSRALRQADSIVKDMHVCRRILADHILEESRQKKHDNLHYRP